MGGERGVAGGGTVAIAVGTRVVEGGQDSEEGGEGEQDLEERGEGEHTSLAITSVGNSAPSMARRQRQVAGSAVVACPLSSTHQIPDAGGGMPRLSLLILRRLKSAF